MVSQAKKETGERKRGKNERHASSSRRGRDVQRRRERGEGRIVRLVDVM